MAKQLKKNDFLAAVADEPMSRKDLVDALIDFEFLPSWLDYLTEHFEAKGKIVRNEDGTVQRKRAAGGGAKVNEIFRVVYDEDDVPSIESRANTGLLKPEDRDVGFRATRKAAIKDANSAVFSLYKARSAALKALLTEDQATESTVFEDAAE